MKCVPVHHGIPAVLHRDEPWLHRHSENGALSYVMPRSHIYGSPRRFYYGLNLTDDPGNANFRSPIRMHYIRGSFFMFVESGCISTNIEFKVP